MTDIFGNEVQAGDFLLVPVSGQELSLLMVRHFTPYSVVGMNAWGHKSFFPTADGPTRVLILTRPEVKDFIELYKRNNPQGLAYEAFKNYL